MKIFFAILIILILLFALLLLDIFLGRAAYRKKAYEPVFSKKKSDIELIDNGNVLFQRLMDDIRQASSSIHVLFFIMKNDEVSHDMYALLKEKAETGMPVYLLLDWAVGRTIKKDTLQTMKSAGVRVYLLNRPAFPYFFFRMQKRNHRKITVIDGKIGYVGGFNIAGEYLGKKAKFGNWEDYHLRMTGEGVADLQTVFLKDLKRNGGNTETASDVFPELPQGNISHTIYASDGFSLEESYLSHIRLAKQSIIICTPYYIPSKRLQQALLEARKNGVSVTLIVPMKSDHPLVREAGFTYYAELLDAGCMIYRFYQGFYHVKAMVIDDIISIIGTANFDKRSFFLNEEMNVVIEDEAFTKTVLETIELDIKKSDPLTKEHYKKRSIRQRPAEWLGKALSYFL
ncbi:cardiolipin synthase [Bacillus atrophaeus]|uniref:cardiolipin synthase n=1 Tax=Bacillus atrophaeus TaxID=1452 RepID=UPI00227F6340|nr:cardiolipin synthase [Bacillus atrophaeus]MCY8499150.1 cardiolipin synthase [Bacillus atrophaeus]MCY8811870.1 cardiolipin synthase [Bacillus atrophaeus]MCY8820803.1 cardiolipin synthase [Bacillus atrophaeus]MCY8827992.1 cardiolipin synthase [Bacillus atrophaeus]MCY8832045.1 cardiolipin synthase [Bacillus atrophaeus]